MDELVVELSLLFIGRVGQVNSDLFAELLGNFLQSQASSLGEEEVDDWSCG